MEEILKAVETGSVAVIMTLLLIFVWRYFTKDVSRVRTTGKEIIDAKDKKIDEQDKKIELLNSLIREIEGDNLKALYKVLNYLEKSSEKDDLRFANLKNDIDLMRQSIEGKINNLK